jgi:hypothetical protein
MRLNPVLKTIKYRIMIKAKLGFQVAIISNHLETARFNGREEYNHDSHLSSFQKHHIRCDVFEKMIDVREAILTFPPLKRRVSR